MRRTAQIQDVAAAPWVQAAAVALLAVQTLWAGQHFFDYNDFMYGAAAARDGRLYDEVHFVQAPVGHAVLALLHDLAPAGWRYATLRLASGLFSLAALLLPAFFLFRAGLQRNAYLVSVATCYFAVRGSLEIGVYSLALLLTSLGLVLLLRGTRWQPLAGLAFALAAATKLSFALNAAPAVLAILLLSPDRATGLRRSAGFLGGFAVGSLPVLFHLWSQPQAFWFHTIAFHTDITQPFRGPKAGLPLILAKLKHFGLVYPGEIAVLLASVVWRLRPARQRRSPAPRSLAIALFLVVAAFGAISPGTLYDQYLILPAMLLSLLAAELIGPDGTAIPRPVLGLWGGLLALRTVAIAGASAYLILGQPNAIGAHGAVSRWLDTAAERIDISKPDCALSLFSTTGSLAIDSRLSPARYTEGGPFWSRLEGHVPERFFTDTETTNFDPTLVAPADYVLSTATAVLIGRFPDIPFEAGFADQAAAAGFEAAGTTRFLGAELRLYLRSRCLG